MIVKNTIRCATAVGAAVSLTALTSCDLFDDGAPELSEIDDLMWESMQEAGSVTMTVDMAAFADDDPETAEMFAQMLGSEPSTMQLYGSLDESATAMSIDDHDIFRTFGENGAYISTDATFGAMEAEAGQVSPEDQQVLEVLVEEFAGMWVDFSTQAQGDESLNELDVNQLLSDFREAWEEEDSSDAIFPRTDIPEEGTEEVRDDTDVWVYTGENEDQELVIEADDESPRMLSISDGEITLTFSDWGETEIPEQPDESELMTEEAYNQVLMDLLLGGSIDLDEPGNGLDELPGTDESPGTDETPGLDETPGTDETPETDESPTEDESGTDFGSGTVDVPGVGSINCDGPVPGDPGMSDPNNNFTEEQIQAIQDACDR